MTLPHLLGICFALLTFVLIIGSILKFILSSLFSAFGQWIEKIKINRYSRAPILLQDKYESVLLKKFPYYSRLSDKSRIKFLLRLHRFVRTNRITGGEDLVVTEEMKIIIGATVIQLTFGLEYYWLNHFSRIIVYPDVFHNPQLDQFHKGETNAKGIVSLSWKHFQEGYENTTDKLNLGLHEMAHALDLSRMVNDADTYFKEYYNKWYIISKGEFENMQDSPSFLRAYGGVNFREFFAVCVEHFFEAPEEFKKNLPDIYKHLTILLRQDPLVSIEKTELVLEQTINIISASLIMSRPEFSSRVSMWGSLLAVCTLMMRLLITFFVIFMAIKTYLFSLAVLILVLVYYFNALLFTRFELFKQHLVIRRPLLLNKIYSFSIDNIISIEFRHSDTDNVRITYFDKGEIVKFKALCSINTKDEEYLLNFLRTKNIVAKSTIY